MRQRRTKVVWPFLLVLVGLFIYVVSMPREWEHIAQRPRPDRPVPKAWEDLSLLPPFLPQEDEKEVVRPLIDEFKIVSAAAQEASLSTGQWMPIKSADPLASQSETEINREPEFELPGLPPVPEVNRSEGPQLKPVSSLSVEDLPELRPSELGAVTERSRETVARRSAVEKKTVPDARDHHREEFSSTSAKQEAQEKESPIWTSPKSLYTQLNELAENDRTADWAKRTTQRVQHLGELVDAKINPSPEVFSGLWAMVSETEPLASRLGDPRQATRLRRAGYALRRRLDVWQRVLTPLSDPTEDHDQEADVKRVRLALADVDTMIRGTDHGHAWREYLLLDALNEVSKSDKSDDVQQRTALARRILGRVAMASLSESQERFLASEPLDRLAVELRRMAAGEPDRARLMAVLEYYEQMGCPSGARLLADECLWLGFRNNKQLADLKRHVTMHYRNANLRMELKESFLNRLMPKRLPEYDDHVRDTVLGNAVRGKSLTATDVGIRMIPDPNRIRLALEISGEVAALTSSQSGPAIFQNTSESSYTARKPMELSVDGLTLFPAEVDRVDNVTRLYKLRTKFDNVPLLGDVVKNAARSQINMKRAEMRREIERKVAVRAKRRIDEEANTRLGSVSEKLKKRVLDPMHGMALGPRMVEAITTEDGLTMRLCIASPRQLGAHTPRPKTPADSLASFQVHQTALNNTVEQLALGGKTFTLPELREHLAQKLNWPELAEKTTRNDNVVITFADQDAVRVTCEDGLFTIDMEIAWLERGRRAWSDFLVRVHYRPHVEGLSAMLVRDEFVELPGRRVPPRAQIQLRGIFNKVFSKNQPRQLVPDRIRNHPKMSDLAVTQMIIDDGWIALAFGPKPQVAKAKGGKAR